jgi:hypothetical protein
MVASNYNERRWSLRLDQIGISAASEGYPDGSCEQKGF